MPRHQRHAIVAAVACLIALIGVVLVQAMPAKAVGRHIAIRPAIVTPAPIVDQVPATTTPATVAPTTVVTAPPATTAPTTAAPVTTAATTPATTPRTTTPVTHPAVAAASKKAVIALLPTGPTSGGSPSDYTLIGYRWNPCQIITVSTSGPDAGLVGTIVTELANITGLHFMMVPSGGAITVAWGNIISGGEVGQTIWHSAGAWLTSANVTIDLLGTPYLGSVLRHELGHAMGLGHAARASEVMYPMVGLSSPTSYQAGDLTGLRAVGTAAGPC